MRYIDDLLLDIILKRLWLTYFYDNWKIYKIVPKLDHNFNKQAELIGYWNYWEPIDEQELIFQKLMSSTP